MYCARCTRLRRPTMRRHLKYPFQSALVVVGALLLFYFRFFFIFANVIGVKSKGWCTQTRSGQQQRGESRCCDEVRRECEREREMLCGLYHPWGAPYYVAALLSVSSQLARVCCNIRRARLHSLCVLAAVAALACQQVKKMPVPYLK
jgi:hypothetical protein